MWKDKHVVMAMIVAPILAIFAWVGVDYIVAEKAQPAEPGSMYPLVARSNCRKTAAPRPKLESLATAIASSSSRTAMTAATGPKSSSS